MAMFTHIQTTPAMQETDHLHLLNNSDPGICMERISAWHEIPERVTETMEIFG
jgi:hypothetical protein